MRVLEGRLKVLDLFSGIGGFSLGLEWAGMETVAFCEIEPFPCAVLRKHWPNVPIFPDIKKLTKEAYLERGLPLPDLICGGPPCQPASVAGKRRGASDDRWLWPETLRIVREFHPRRFVFENPCGILSLRGGLVFKDLLSEMEAQNYEVWPVVIPACGVGAPHRRDRVWIIAHSESDGAAADTINEGCVGRGGGGDTDRQGFCPDKQTRQEPRGATARRDEDVTDAEKPGLQRPDTERQVCARGRAAEHGSIPGWTENWYAVATRFCRVDARISNRVDRLKALGNAVVPQVVYQIGQAIARGDDSVS
jgi:DNA (cytosine-5)-methyltransferase 1